MALYIAPNDSKRARLGISVNAKIAPASGRNKLKRLAREAFRLNKDKTTPGLDYLVIFSRMLSKKACCDIRKTALTSVEKSFIELADKGHKLFEKRRAKS